MPTEHPTRQRLLLLLRASKGVTLRELGRLTGLSRTSVRRHVGAMKRTGLVDCKVVHRSVGRPSCVYRLTPAVRYGGYSELLRLLHAGLQRQGRGAVDGRYQEIARQVAMVHPEIRWLPDSFQRLEAARRVVFGDVDSTPTVIADGRCEFSFHTCPLATIALEFRELCGLARSVLSELVGAEVEQSEWIVRGDPRCTFEISASPQNDRSQIA